MYRLLLKRKGLILAIFVAAININFAYGQNCSATLSVEKDRNAKSAYQDNGATFNMVLTNTSSRKDTYNILTENLSESCASDTYKTSAPNVPLNVEIKGHVSSNAASSSITLAAGETRKFTIYVTVPARTASKSWSCIKVSAKGVDCNQSLSSTILRVYVPEPSEG